MNWRLVATVGVGVAAFLLAAAAVTGLLSATIEFSALVGLPVGLVVGAAAAAATRLPLWNAPGARPAVFGVAAVGYAILVVAAASYAISSAWSSPCRRGAARISSADAPRRGRDDGERGAPASREHDEPEEPEQTHAGRDGREHVLGPPRDRAGGGARDQPLVEECHGDRRA